MSQKGRAANVWIAAARLKLMTTNRGKDSRRRPAKSRAAGKPLEFSNFDYLLDGGVHVLGADFDADSFPRGTRFNPKSYFREVRARILAEHPEQWRAIGVELLGDANDIPWLDRLHAVWTIPLPKARRRLSSETERIIKAEAFRKLTNCATQGQMCACACLPRRKSKSERYEAYRKAVEHHDDKIREFLDILKKQQ
jgi:hypothetical protein